ncbi:iron-containing alcohol dehydrogenase [Fodinicola feengrottensis]|uniref:Iron-containing alcohol dehydrogenase n=1 Tax=Fodinicola feengrottensis TaxID=435914 RepID=A0ABN2J0Y6_9ACTN
MTTFSIEPTGRIEFGAGILDQLANFIASTAQHRVLLVTDQGLRATGIVDRALKILTAAGLEHTCYDAIGPNPSTTAIDTAAATARVFGPAAIVALGGGSVLDAAKAIALLAANPSASTGDWTAPGWPLIAIPTTSGTGAETNGFAVIEDTHRRRKVYIGHSSVKPRIAVLDPELTLRLPPHVTAATGIDALVHGLESLASRNANAVSIGYAAEAVRLVSRWLPVAYADGSDLDARGQVMVGAHLAGQALTISGLGLVHGFGHAITAFTGTAHGVALASVLAAVMRFSPEAYEPAGFALSVDDPVAAALDIADGVDIVRPLRDLDVDRGMLPAIAATALADAVTRNSPRVPSLAEATALLESAY